MNKFKKGEILIQIKPYEHLEFYNNTPVTVLNTYNDIVNFTDYKWRHGFDKQNAMSKYFVRYTCLSKLLYR